MKNSFALSFLFLNLFLVASCNSDDSNPFIPESDPLTGWNKIQDFSNEYYSISLYSKQKQLQVGSNPLVLQVNPKSDADHKNITAAHWNTTMHMGSMKHGAPVLDLKPYQHYTDLFEGNLFFQMASDGNDNFWKLEVQFEANSQKTVISKKVEVLSSKLQTIQSFKGSDNTNYVIALIAPTSPKIGMNDMTTALFKMESMDTFTVVNQYKVLIDPRMPSMNNHGSPNNVNLTQSTGDLLYHGKLSLTMTGYWKINLQLLDDSGNSIKGEVIDDTTLSSSLFFELEF